MRINASSSMRTGAAIVAAASLGRSASADGGNVTYNIYAGGCPPFNVGGRGKSNLMVPQAQEIGTCQNHGVGRGAYNSIEVLGCSDQCLCFKQVAAESADAKCDTSKARGWNVKMSCFDKCLLDCNGRDCGETAKPGDFPMRLMLTGSGPICASPVSEEEFVCETTGMILDESGEVIDAFVTDVISNGRLDAGAFSNGTEAPASSAKDNETSSKEGENAEVEGGGNGDGDVTDGGNGSSVGIKRSFSVIGVLGLVAAVFV